MEAVLERAVGDAQALEKGGVHGVIVENFHDAPFYASRVPPETVAAMTRVVAAVRTVLQVPVGVNVLRNDARAALAVAAATEAPFIRVNVHTGAMLTDQGWIRGEAEATLRMRRRLEVDVAILADVFVKHAKAAPRVTIADAARDCWERGLPDGLIVSGSGTGRPTESEDIRAVRAAAPDAPIWVGSGVSAETAPDLLTIADGFIVGSALHTDGALDASIDPERVRSLVELLRG